MKRPVPNKPTEMIAITGSTRRAVPEAKLMKKSDQTDRIKVSIYARQNPAAPGKNPLAPDAMNNTGPTALSKRRGVQLHLWRRPGGLG